MRHLNFVAIAVSSILTLNITHISFAIAELQTAMPATEPVFLPQVDKRLNNQALRERIYSVEDQLIIQTDSIAAHSESIAALEGLVTELMAQLKLAQEQLDIAERDAADTKQSVNRLRDELQAQIKGSSASTKAELSDLHSKLSQLNAAIDFLEDELNSIQMSMGRELTDVRSRFDRSNDQFSERFQSVDQQVNGLSGDVSNQRLLGGAGLIGLVVLLLVLALWMRSGSKALSVRLKDTSDELHKEHLNLDLKLATLLERQLDAASVGAQSAATAEVDHTLPLQVAAEIHRMQKRLAAFPDDVKGVKPLVKALDRLNESLRDKDYEVVELLGSKYVEGMTIQASFVPDDSLDAGEQVITKIVKPQVNYQDNIIQIAQVEVSIGE